MRIVQFAEAAAAGVGRHIVDLTNGLLDRGHEVHLVYSDLRADRVFSEDLRRLGEREGFRARRILMRRELHTRDLLAVRSMQRYLRGHGPFDLVHCHSTKAGLVGRLGLGGDSVRTLYTPHCLFTMIRDRNRFMRCAVAMLELGLSKLCDGIIVVSREEYEHAVQLGISPSKLCLIPNGAALACAPARSRTDLRQEWGLNEGDVCIGFVGRLVPQKSPETMLRSFASLLRGKPSRARLAVVGDGKLAGPCRRLAAELGISTRVLWLGSQDAKTFMHAFDMLALTSDFEGHPLVILEAMARGLPIVATRVGGVSETVRHGVNGFVVPVRDTAAIAGSLATLINDPAIRERMGLASRTMSLDFSVDRMVDRTIALYRQVIAGAWDGRAASELSAAASR